MTAPTSAAPPDAALAGVSQPFRCEAGDQPASRPGTSAARPLTS